MGGAVGFEGAAFDDFHSRFPLWVVDERFHFSPHFLLLNPHTSFRRIEICLPFSRDHLLREQYISPFGDVRIGRLLEVSFFPFFC